MVSPRDDIRTFDRQEYGQESANAAAGQQSIRLKRGLGIVIGPILLGTIDFTSVSALTSWG